MSLSNPLPSPDQIRQVAEQLRQLIPVDIPHSGYKLPSLAEQAAVLLDQFAMLRAQADQDAARWTAIEQFIANGLQEAEREQAGKPDPVYYAIGWKIEGLQEVQAEMTRLAASQG